MSSRHEVLSRFFPILCVFMGVSMVWLSVMGFTSWWSGSDWRFCLLTKTAAELKPCQMYSLRLAQ